METRRWYNRFYVVIALAGMLLMDAPQTVFIPAAYADDSIEVECYIKDDNDYMPVGNVDVFDASKAAATGFENDLISNIHGLLIEYIRVGKLSPAIPSTSLSVCHSNPLCNPSGSRIPRGDQTDETC